MESLTNDIVTGTCCELCGQYFKDPTALDNECFVHGHPVVCYECFDKLEPVDQKTYHRANVETF